MTKNITCKNTVINIVRNTIFKNPLKIVSNSLLIGMIATSAYPAFAETSLQETLQVSQVSQVSQVENSVLQKLYGTWDLKNTDPDFSNFGDIRIVFASNNIFHVFFSKEKSQNLIGKYKISLNSQQIHLDLTSPLEGDEDVKAIIEFTKKGELRIASSSPGEPRPKDFTSKIYTFSKISDSTKVPESLTSKFQAPDLNNPIVKKLQGTWNLKDPKLPGEKTSFVFTPSGKLFLSIDGNLYKTQYEINSKAQPMHLDINLIGTDETVKTIFEFTDNGNLRIEMDKSAPGKPRPNTYPDDSPLLEKVSESTEELKV